MSVVGEITPLCGRECLLQPVVAQTSTHCFCLIWSPDLAKQWPVCFLAGVWSFHGELAVGGNLMVCVFGLFIPSAAAPLNHAGSVTREDEQEENMSLLNPRIFPWPGAVLWALQQKARWWDSVIPGLTRRLQSQVERCLGQHLNPFFHACQFWNQQQPLKTEVYTADEDSGACCRPLPCSVPWVILIKK